MGGRKDIWRRKVTENSGLVRGRGKVAGRQRVDKAGRDSTMCSNISPGNYLYSVAKANLELWKMNLTTTRLWQLLLGLASLWSHLPTAGHLPFLSCSLPVKSSGLSEPDAPAVFCSPQVNPKPGGLRSMLYSGLQIKTGWPWNQTFILKGITLI